MDYGDSCTRQNVYAVLLLLCSTRVDIGVRVLVALERGPHAMVPSPGKGCVCVCVCVCVFIYLCLCVYIYIYVCVRESVCVSMCERER